MVSLALNVATQAGKCAVNAPCRNAAFAAAAATLHAVTSAVKDAVGSNSQSSELPQDGAARSSGSQSGAAPAAATPAPKPPNDDCDKKIDQFYQDLDGYLTSGSSEAGDKARQSLQNYNKDCKESDPYFNERSSKATRRHDVTVRLHQSTNTPRF